MVNLRLGLSVSFAPAEAASAGEGCSSPPSSGEEDESYILVGLSLDLLVESLILPPED